MRFVKTCSKRSRRLFLLLEIVWMFTRGAYLDVYTFQLVIVIIIIFFAAHLRTMLRRLPYFGAQ